MASGPVTSADVHRGVGRRAERRRLVLALVVADFAAITLAGLVAAWLRFGTVYAKSAFENSDTQFSFVALSLITAGLWTAVMALSGMYDPHRAFGSIGDAGKIARTLSMGVVTLILGTYIVRTPGLSRAWVLLTWVVAIALVIIARALVWSIVVLARRRGGMMQPTLIVGSNLESADIIRVLRANPDAGLVPMGCLTSSQAEKLELDFCSGDIPVLGSAREIQEVLAAHDVATVVIASSAFDHDVLARMIAELRDRELDVHISSGLFEVLTSRVLVNEIAGVPLITVKGLTVSRRTLVTKRLFDLVCATLAVVLGLPIWALIALGIKLTSPGPVFYAQDRIGRNGRTFRMLKFRSMYRDADARLAELQSANEASGAMFKMKDDPRVTPIGKWMRKFSIDEFPQLINVLSGEMSLVGPRPPLPQEVERYTAHDWRRLEVTPGMTGLWQISGRSRLTFDEMVRLDLFYIENWSVGLDVSIIFRTVPAVLLARGAY